jgi:hypothetical protein
MNRRVPQEPTRRPLLVLHDGDCLSYHVANIIQGSGIRISPKFLIDGAINQAKPNENCTSQRPNSGGGNGYLLAW